MAAPKHGKGEARALYLDLLKQAGTAGVPLLELAKQAGVTRTGRVLGALQPDLESGAVKRHRPTTSQPSTLYLSEFWSPKPPRVRVYTPKGTDRRCITKQNEWLAHLKLLGDSGALIAELEAHFGVSNQTASAYLQGLSIRGEVVSVYKSEGKSNRLKRWFAAEYMPKATQKKPAQQTTTWLDPKAPAIIPAGVRITRAETPKPRFEFTPPPGWRGQISAAEARPWAMVVARG
jgi:hypothetical protein